MAWDAEFAQELRRRDNKKSFEPQIGEVVSVSPLRIAMLFDNVILERAQIYLCAALAEGQRRACAVSLPSVSETGSVTFSEVLAVGDLVACVPTAQAAKFIVVDRVVM